MDSVQREPDRQEERECQRSAGISLRPKQTGRSRKRDRMTEPEPTASITPGYPPKPADRVSRRPAPPALVLALAGACAWACADAPASLEAGRSAALSVTPSAAGPVEVGDEVRLVAESRDAGGRLAAGYAVSWTSSDPRVATVSADGVVMAVGPGTAGITAEAGGATATARFSVASPDRAALEALYNATGGPSWTNSTGWLTDAPVGDWHGVTTDSVGRVVGLHLQSNRLTGEIPAELGSLAGLEQLYLQRNRLSGGIPAELGGLASLQWLLLNHNALSGAVPAELGRLSALALAGLLLNDNADLAGALPLALSSLSSLDLFRYDGTGLCVPDDASFRAWLNAIRTHRGTGVDCDGTASSDGSLSALSLSGVGLNPAFSPGTLNYTASVGNDVAQTTVAATANSAAASVAIAPADADAATAGHQVTLAVGDNTITVGVTAEDGTRMDYAVTVTRGGGNRSPAAVGAIPARTLAPGGTATVDASGYFSDPDADALTYSAASSNANVARASVSGSTVTITALARGSATITVTARDPGGLTASQEARVTVSTGAPQTERDILEALYNATGGPSWTNGTGWLTDAPLGDWHGVTTDSDGRVTALHLQSNRLTGGIPADLGSLTGLEQLYLQRNQLSGSIPAELGGLASLQWLLLNDNALSGAVPAELGRLSALTGLLLNDNADLAGALPLALSSLSALNLFRYDGTGLCVPTDASFRAWLNAIRTHRGTGVDCGGSPDASLSALSLSGVALNPAFSSNVTAYAASVGNDVAQTTVAATANSAAASVAIAPADADAAAVGHQVALAVGSNTITVSVTAEDGTEQAYSVTVTRQAGGGANRSPAAVGAIAARTLVPGGTATVDASAYFSDPDGDALTYSASSSDTNIARASVSGSTVTITAVAQGSATITVTARDAGGLTASQEARVTVSTGAPQTERDILVALYNATGGPSWTNGTGWLTDAPVGDWHGVTTDSDGRVTALHLQSNRLTGGIPADLGSLTGLEQLYLQRNQLSGSIPAELGGLASLQWLLLNDNALSGAVPAELGRLSALTGLLLNDNADLAGALPLALSSLSALNLFRYDGTGLCVPTDAWFRAWLNAIRTHRGTGVDCEGSPDASLSALSLSGVALNPAFSSNVTAYAASVGNDVAQTTVDATPRHSAATVAIMPADADAAAAGHQVDLDVGDNDIAVRVRAEDGTEQDYTVTVTRQVGNRSPVAVGTIPDLELMVNESATFEATAYFNEPDGQPLTYAASVSDSSRLNVSTLGATVTLVALAKGEVTVTVTATDPGGLAAIQTFQVTIPNRPPIALDPIPALTIEVAEAHSFDASSFFTDADGDALSYTATVSDSTKVAVAFSSATLTVTARARGQAEVTVTATDTEGAYAAHTFQVTVPNRAPSAADPIPAQVLFKSRTVPLDLRRRFADPDGDALDYAAETTRSTVATATVHGTTLTIRTGAAGETTITVTATDPGGLRARQSFTVAVQNRAPTATVPISNQTLNERDSRTLDVSPHFEDPDGDPLTYSASTSNSRVATAWVSRSNVTVRGILSGKAEITVTAADPDGASVARSFMVTVERSTQLFDIQLGFGPNVTPSQERVFRSAASYWQSALRFSAFPDVAVNGALSCSAGGVTAEVTIRTLDDVGVVFTVADLDGERGTLALARLCFVRAVSGIPMLGLVVFDRADVDRLARTGTLLGTATHEIAHILGFGLGLWERRGLLRNPSDGNPTADTHFAGTRAIAAFDAAGGSSYSGAKVPVENGRDDAHWRESVLGDELMTPRLRLGPRNPLSAITLQSFADIGYSIDASKAESYRLPATGRAAAIAAAEATAEIVSYGNDVERGPIRVLDGNGKVVQVLGDETALRERAGPVIRVILGQRR